MNRYQRQILRELMSSEIPLTSDELGKILSVSSKTIQRNIKDLKILLNANGADLITKPRVGISLIINDTDKLNKFLSIQTKSGHLPSTPDERVLYIIDKLLYSDDYIKTEVLADRLFISNSRLYNDIKHVREVLKKII